MEITMHYGVLFLIGLIMFGMALGCMHGAAVGFAIIGAGIVVATMFCALLQYLNGSAQ